MSAWSVYPSNCGHVFFTGECSKNIGAIWLLTMKIKIKEVKRSLPLEAFTTARKNFSRCITRYWLQVTFLLINTVLTYLLDLCCQVWIWPEFINTKLHTLCLKLVFFFFKVIYWCVSCLNLAQLHNAIYLSYFETVIYR